MKLPNTVIKIVKICFVSSILMVTVKYITEQIVMEAIKINHMFSLRYTKHKDEKQKTQRFRICDLFRVTGFSPSS